jgi:hypothetical protein
MHNMAIIHEKFQECTTCSTYTSNCRSFTSTLYLIISEITDLDNKYQMLHHFYRD